jgi:hypothetical protein
LAPDDSAMPLRDIPHALKPAGPARRRSGWPRRGEARLNRGDVVGDHDGVGLSKVGWYFSCMMIRTLISIV